MKSVHYGVILLTQKPLLIQCDSPTFLLSGNGSLVQVGGSHIIILWWDCPSVYGVVDQHLLFWLVKLKHYFF